MALFIHIFTNLVWYQPSLFMKQFTLNNNVLREKVNTIFVCYTVICYDVIILFFFLFFLKLRSLCKINLYIIAATAVYVLLFL